MSVPPAVAVSVGASGENFTLPASAVADPLTVAPACTLIAPVPTSTVWSAEVSPFVSMYAFVVASRTVTASAAPKPWLPSEVLDCPSASFALLPAAEVSTPILESALVGLFASEPLSVPPGLAFAVVGAVSFVSAWTVRPVA